MSPTTGENRVDNIELVEIDNPKAGEYIVVAGDYLAKIAARFGTTDQATGL